MIFEVSQIAEPVVERIVEQVSSYVTNKFHELYRVESEIENLSSRLTAIQAALQDAERVLADSDSKRLVDWLTKLRKVALDVEDVLATYATEAALRRELKQKFSAPLAWLRFRLKAANEIKEAVRRIDMISEEKEKFHFGGHYVNPNSRPQTTRVGLREISCLRDPSDIIGRKTEKEEIVSWLLSDESNLQGDVPVHAIIGMGGLGKTTLAQAVFNDERIKEKKDEKRHFKATMWVNVSADFSVDRILKEMLEFLTGMKQDMRPRSMIEDHILQVLGGGRLLLLLDDVWPEKLEWDSFHSFLKLCPQGSKVLITSRNEDVAKKMGALHPQKLRLMSEDDCWLLFAQRAFIADNFPGELEEIGRQIVHKCKFLPLAVKAMAGLLRGNTDVHRWQNILKKGIWESEQSPFGNETSNILPALKLSYDDLPSQLKQCFAYCSIFPKGYMFDKNELVKLWIAEGYIQPRGADKVEDAGSDYFDELLIRSFFQLLDVKIDRAELFEHWIAEGYIPPGARDHFDEMLRGGHLGEYEERYKMHDLIHDMAKSVSRQQVVENEASSITPESRHISFIGKDAQKLADEILKAQKLRTLLLPATCTTDFGQTLDKVFRTLSYLRVLDLSSSTIKNLPESIGKLRLLGYLDLSRTDIRILPNAICNLHNLQILKLLRCVWFWELPKDLGNLKNLRYLELDDMFWYKCSALPPRIGGLTNLHNLHSFHVRQESGYRIEELKFMKNLEGVLHISNLENSEDAKSAELKEKECISKLVLEWSDKDVDPRERTVQERVLEDLEPHHGLQKLQINNFKGNQFSSWMGILRNLEEVSLNHCTNCRILTLGPLPHLRVLCIKGILELVQWPEPEVAYGSLNRLSISNCPQLRELPCIFPNLRVAKIKQCDALTALPLMPSLMFLRLINNALLEDRNEALITIATRNDGGDNLITIGGSYMNLLELKISNCPMLQALPQTFFPQKLEISRCTSLRTLPIPEHSQRLHHLELDKCIGPSLIEEIPSTSSLKSLIVSNVRYIFSFPQLPHLPGLTALYIDSCQDLLTLSYADGFLQNLSSLKFLSISGCRKLVTFPDEDLPTSIEWLSIKDCLKLRSLHPRNCLVRLTSLKDLSLEDCPMLRFLPEDGLPTLQHLRIQGCPLLAQRCSEGKAGQYWPMIRHIADLEIDLIKTPEPSGCIRPKKRHFCCFRA